MKVLDEQGLATLVQNIKKNTVTRANMPPDIEILMAVSGSNNYASFTCKNGICEVYIQFAALDGNNGYPVVSCIPKEYWPALGTYLYTVEIYSGSSSTSINQPYMHFRNDGTIQFSVSPPSSSSAGSTAHFTWVASGVGNIDPTTISVYDEEGSPVESWKANEGYVELVRENGVLTKGIYHPYTEAQLAAQRQALSEIPATLEEPPTVENATEATE